MPAPPRFLRVAFVAAALCAACAVSAQDPSARFDAGVAAYREGDTAAALAAFQDAQAAGLDSPQLQFNLGLCYYRLERYTEARAAFERLAQFPEYGQIADFHLGLIAAQQGERERAETLFLSVEREAPQAAMRERARIARQRLDGAADARASGYVLLGAGYDSNPALIDESLQASGGESKTTEVFGAVELPLSVGPQAVTWLQGGGYARSYDENLGLDQDGVFAGLTRETGRRRYSLDASSSKLEGERFTDTVAIGAEGGARPGDMGTALSVQLAHIAAASAYDHLDGWRLRTEIERSGRAGSAGLRAGVQLEFNDRADLQSGNEFFSHSPLRGRVSLALENTAGAWSLQWSARYRHSRYLDPNRFLDGGVLRVQRRAENLLQGGLRARCPLGTSFNWLVEYQYSRNTSTIEAFAYDRQLVLTGLEWVPRGD